jgi:hypothetical protein
MFDVTVVCKLVLEKSIGKYGPRDDLIIPEEHERVVAAQIFELIEDLGKTDSDLETETSLELDVEGHIDIYCNLEDSSDPDEEYSQESTQEWESLEIDKITFTFSTIRSIINFYDNCKSNKFDQTRRRYPNVKLSNYITRFRKYLEENGTSFEKFQRVEIFTFNQFEFARAKLLNVTDRDLKRWAVTKAREIRCRFQASDSWIRIFKNRNRIVSRKITKYLSIREVNEKSDIEAEAEEFVERVKNKILGVDSCDILNFDQSGFTYEFAPNRTLSYKGEKVTQGLIKNKNATTHSYTIMPLISMSGKLVSKLLICLQETGGSFGPRVWEGLTIPDNIFLTCSKSGKLDKRIMKRWVDECVAPVCN